MNIYALLVALVLVTALLMRGYQQGNKRYVIVACLLLFAVFGLRDCFSIGNDSSSSYLHRFQEMPDVSWAEITADGFNENMAFRLLMKAVYEITHGDYQVFITLIAAFVTVAFGRMIYRYSPNPLASILYHFGLLFYLFHFSALKQSIAMAILMLAFDQIINRKPVRFVLIVLIASQFHFPSLVFLPAYWIARMKLGRNFIILLGVMLILTYFFRSQLLSWMLSLYKDEEAFVSMEGIQFLRTKVLIMIVIVIAAILFRRPRAEDRIYSILLGFMGLAIVLQTFCGYNNIFERLADYYFQFSVLFLPMVFDKHADREPLFGWRFMSVVDLMAPYLFCGYGAYRFITTAARDPTVFPYRFFFQA